MKVAGVVGQLVLIFVICLVISLFWVTGSALAQNGSGGAATGIPPFEATPEALALIAGALLSLAFSYVPKLNTVYAVWAPEYKRLVMLGLLLISAVSIYFLGCGSIIQAGITCDHAGILKLTYIFFLAVMSNQSTFTITPQTTAVKAAKTITG